MRPLASPFRLFSRNPQPSLEGQSRRYRCPFESPILRGGEVDPSLAGIFQSFCQGIHACIALNKGESAQRMALSNDTLAIRRLALAFKALRMVKTQQCKGCTRRLLHYECRYHADGGSLTRYPLAPLTMRISLKVFSTHETNTYYMHGHTWAYTLTIF